MEQVVTIRFEYVPRARVFTPTKVTMPKSMSLKELRSIVCMAQGSPREIPAHVLAFIGEHSDLRGETMVKVGEDRTEVLK